MAEYDISGSNREPYSRNENNFKTMTLNQFINTYNSSSEKDVPIINDMLLAMDKKMQMYHDHNYVITSFDINKTYIYEAEDKYGNLIFDADYSEYMPIDQSQSTVKDNVFYLACLAVGIYNNCLSYIDPSNPKFLKENFNLFAENMPQEVVPYYRGIIERGFSVYLNEFVDSRNQQEIAKMQEEAKRMAEEEAEKKKKQNISSTPKVKPNSAWGINGDAAFSAIAFFPIVFLLLGVIIPIIFLIFS